MKKEKLPVKQTSNKFLIITSILFVVTVILGLIFIFNTNDLLVTKSIWNNMTEGVNGSNPGDGELVLIALGVTLLSGLGEIFALLLIMVIYALIPMSVTLLNLVLSLVSKLFQLGENKKWKNTTSKVFLYIVTTIQGLLTLYTIVLALTGFSLIYIVIYLMIIANIYVFIKDIQRLKNISN